MTMYKRKFLSLMLLLALVVSLIPFTAQDVTAAESDYIDFSINEYGRVTVTGHTSDPKGFVRIELGVENDTKWYLMSEPYEQDLKYCTFETATEDIEIGYHGLRAKLSDGTYVYASKPVPVGLGQAPLKPSGSDWITTGPNYIIFKANQSVPEECDGMYVQINKDKIYGPVKSWESIKIKGLKANTTYTVQTFFRKKVNYQGKTTYITSKKSSAVKVKTGKTTKPQIKSIKVSNVKQTKKTYVQQAHWDANGVWHPYLKTTGWETSFKVTVTLKKKPGTKGIYIGSTKCKGNKTKYTATVKMSGKQKGKTIKLGVCTYNDNTYGGYSGQITKRIKIA